MKEIKIRFVKTISKNETSYTIERKTFFGFWEIGGWENGGGYGHVWCAYSNKSKKKLLAEVLDDYYKIPASKVKIIQYPTIKIYSL